MRNDHRTVRTSAAAPRPLLALVLAVCLLVSALPTAWASSVGSGPSSLTRSTAPTYVKLSRSVLIFQGDTYGSGVSLTLPAGTVCQLYSENYYTASDGLQYYSLYYLNTRYNVLRTDIQGDIMTAAETETYITGTLWKQTAYSTLRERDGLVGDIRVHAVQLALSRLGYYSGALDGDYGEKTNEAMKQFQRKNGLDPDGSAGPLSQPVLFALASGSTVPGTGGSSGGGSSSSGSGSGGSSGSGSTSNGSTAPSSGTLKTTASVNLRKSASTSSARLAVVPKGVNLSYTETYVRSGVTWFKVRYNSLTGWLMGTFVSAAGNASSPAIGTVTITMPGTRVRDAADGNKTGTVLAKGTVVDLLAQPTSAGGYTWYNIRTSSGLVGFVRGDCASASIGGGSGSGSGGSSGVVPSSDKTFVRLPSNTLRFTTETMPSSGGITVAAGTVLQMVNTTTYNVGGVEYCTLYYNNQRFNAVYSDVKSGILSSDQLAAYVKTLWSSALGSSLKRELGLVGDVRVYALQVALSSLGYYTGNLDGTYGSGTESAVRNYQRKAKISVDGDCGVETWSVLTAQVLGSGGSGGSGGSDGGSGGGSITVTDFGTVNRVVKASWDWDNAGIDLFPKGSYATVMDVATGKVFRIYRWSGSRHADCVPATAADTKVMCDIVGFPYNSNHPNSSQLAQIKADGDSDVVNYTWPDFKNKFGGATNIGSAWDRRAALLNVNGTVYPVSIYGFPHGFNGTDSFSKSRFSNGQYFYAVNNYYGMMCVHFVGSTTHGGTSPDSKHQAAINTAYDYAKKLWPTLVR